jgi:hypothetical protein
MSLKAFHIVFVTASILLCFGFAAWSYENYQDGHDRTDMILTALAVLFGLALIAYEILFVKKARKIVS